MTKKKVTAPLTYNPGKGRPKEHLAYLNYQEMQALKRLNGNNQERGPRGLPSFPPADATSGSYNSGYGSGGSRPSSGGPRSGVSGSVSPSSGSPRGSNPPSGGGGSNSGSRPSGGMMGGTGSGGSSRTSPSVGSGNKGNVGGMRSGPGGTGGYKTPGAGGSNADRAAINAANKTNTLSAQKAPAFKADTGRTVNVGPMGAPVKVGAPASRPSIPKATVQSPMAGQGASFASPLDARIENFQRINYERLKSGALGPEGVPSVSKIAAENARRLNAAKMAQQYSQYRSPPRSYPAAPQGVYGPRVGVGTSYLGTTDMPGMITTGMTSPYSGTINPRFNAAQTLMAYEAEKRVPGKIQDRVPPTERFSTAKTRGIGAIPQSYPNTPPPGIPSGFKVEKSNISRGRFGEPVLREKEVTDRLLQEPSYRPYDIRVTSPPAPIMDVSFDTGLKNKIQDRILPQSEYSGYGGSAPPRTRGIGDVQLPRSQYSGYGEEGYSTLSGIPTPESSGLLPTKYPDYRPPSRSSYPNYKPPSESSAFDPSRLAAYDSNFGPELSASVGSDIEKALIGDASPTYPDSGPPGGVRSLEGFSPATPAYKNVSPISPGSMPYDVRLGEVKISVPMGDENRKVVIGSTTIDKYVEAMPDLTSAEKANLRRSMIGKTVAGDGKLEFTVEEVLQMKDEAKGEAMVVDGSGNTAEGVPGAENAATDYTDDADVYGPKFVDPEIQELMRKQEKLNKRGVGVMKRVPVLGPVVTAADALTKLFTGETIAGGSADLKRAYMQASDEQKAALEDKYPNLTKFASDAGLTPKRDISNYTNWADKSGLRAPPSREGGRDNSGIASLVEQPRGDETTTPSPDTPSTTPGRRPDIYYMWDLGINIPSPSDPNYNQYQTYLAERLAAQRAMGYV